jgi:hypothetical protein
MHKNIKTAITLTLALVFLGCDAQNKKSDLDSMNSSNILDLDAYELSDLNDSQKYSLEYMLDEEKLAFDLYLELNKVHPNVKFTNIANNSEIKHIQYVEDLIQRYDINISNDTLLAGEFRLEEIQNLYNTLYNQGTASLADALKVGCIVEVTDINDLNEHIEDAGDAQDLIDTFEVLRVGSYNHYWGFDSALKLDAGVEDGCCSLGSYYCKSTTEYPKNSRH